MQAVKAGNRIYMYNSNDEGNEKLTYKLINCIVYLMYFIIISALVDRSTCIHHTCIKTTGT